MVINEGDIGKNFDSGKEVRETSPEFEDFRKRFGDYEVRYEQIKDMVAGNDYIPEDTLRGFSTSYSKMRELKEEIDFTSEHGKDPEDLRIKVLKAGDRLVGALYYVQQIEGYVDNETKRREEWLQGVEKKLADYKQEYDKVKDDPSLSEKERSFLNKTCQKLEESVMELKNNLKSPSQKNFDREVKSVEGFSFGFAWQNMRHVQRIISGNL